MDPEPQAYMNHNHMICCLPTPSLPSPPYLDALDGFLHLPGGGVLQLAKVTGHVGDDLSNKQSTAATVTSMLMSTRIPNGRYQ